jgi:hypothetical protein
MIDACALLEEEGSDVGMGNPCVALEDRGRDSLDGSLEGRPWAVVHRAS